MPASRPSLLSTHAHVLLCIASGASTRLRDIARELDMTERAIQLVVNDLAEAGYISRHRLGRRSYYEVHPGARSEHPAESALEAGALLRAALPRETRTPVEA